MTVEPVPSNYPSLIPVAALERCEQAVAFYKSVLGATENLRLSMPDGSIAHIELKIGSSMLMLGEAMPAHGYPATTLRLSVYVPDCDATFRKAIAAGATEKRPLTDQFYGDRSGAVVDPWGLEWTFLTHIKDMTPQEMEAEMKRLYGG
jgi:PhnB protein